MKKTVTTILSLALALILVSSLSSGVIYANGRHHRDRQVVIMDCDLETALGIIVTHFDKSSSVDVMLPVEETTNGCTVLLCSCAENVAFLLNNNFREENATSALGRVSITTRYTFVKK